MTSRRQPIVPPAGVAMALVAGVLVGAAGCTICRDPFDYTGPVPNGSPPQNDFRARSGGITPLDGAPRPWPPVVRTVPAADAPTAVVAAAEPAAEAPSAEGDPVAADVQPTSAEAPSAGDEAAALEEEAVEPEVEAAIADSGANVVGNVRGPSADEAAEQEVEPSAEAPAEANQADVVAPRPAETEPAPAPEEPILDEILPPARLPRQRLVPPLRETPGWRTRG